MMTEDQVVKAVTRWFQDRGCTVIGTCLGSKPGVDVEALSPEGLRFCVECKGSKSPRSDREFSVTDCWTRLSGALFNTVRDVETHDVGSCFAMALPATDIYKSMMKDLREFCRRNRLIVLWLESTGVIDVWQAEPNKLLHATREDERA